MEIRVKHKAQRNNTQNTNIVGDYGKRKRRNTWLLILRNYWAIAEDVTADEKLALLEAYEAPAPGRCKKWKAHLIKPPSDLAAANKALKGPKMTEDEAKKAARLEAEKAIKDELDALRKENAVQQEKIRRILGDLVRRRAGNRNRKGAWLTAIWKKKKVFVFENQNQKKHIEKTFKKPNAPQHCWMIQKPPPWPGGSGGVVSRGTVLMGHIPCLKLITNSPNYSNNLRRYNKWLTKPNFPTLSIRKCWQT